MSGVVVGALIMLASLAAALFVGAFLRAGSGREASDLHDPTPMIAERRQRYAELDAQIDAARDVTPFAVVRDDIATAADRAIDAAVRPAKEVEG